MPSRKPTAETHEPPPAKTKPATKLKVIHTLEALRSKLAVDTPIDWTERWQYRQSLKESERLLDTGRKREAQLIAEAEHAAELQYLRRKVLILARIKRNQPPEA